MVVIYILYVYTYMPHIHTYMKCRRLCAKKYTRSIWKCGKRYDTEQSFAASRRKSTHIFAKYVCCTLYIQVHIAMPSPSPILLFSLVAAKTNFFRLFHLTANICFELVYWVGVCWMSLVWLRIRRCFVSNSKIKFNK